jgi:membrane fusion protein (multidrug efflux system)
MILRITLLRAQLALLLALAGMSGRAMAEDYACLIEPRQVHKLATPVQGVISSVAVDRGDRVRKGQQVANLDSEVEEANLMIARLRAQNDTEVAAAQAKFDYLKRKLARKSALGGNSYGSQQELEEAQSDARVAEAQLRENSMNLNQARLEAIRAEGLLHQRKILSPVDGIVTERAMAEGEFINDQGHILTIAEMDPLRIETFLPITLYRHVKVGDVAEVMPEDPVGGSYPAKVVVVDQVFDAASNTIGVRLELPNPDLRLPAGVHCHVRLSGPS